MTGLDPVRALLIDLDGTLADSLGLLWTVYSTFLRCFGSEGTSAEFDDLNGSTTAEVVGALRETHRLHGSHEQLLRQYLDLVAAGYADVEPSPGAAALLEVAQSRGWATAVVTSNGSAVARGWLNSVGLASLVDELVGGEMVARGKPHPEPYLTALAAVGACADRSLAVEDSLAGVASARAAGVRTFLLRSESTSLSDLGPAGPDVDVIGRLEDLVPYLSP